MSTRGQCSNSNGRERGLILWQSGDAGDLTLLLGRCLFVAFPLLPYGSVLSVCRINYIYNART